jgi:hypothetical protein
VKAITLRNVPEKVAEAIEKKAKETHMSLNRAVVSLLEEGLGLVRKNKFGKKYTDLDHLAGSWTKAEADEFDKHLREMRQIDKEMWA